MGEASLILRPPWPLLPACSSRGATTAAVLRFPGGSKPLGRIRLKREHCGGAGRLAGSPPLVVRCEASGGQMHTCFTFAADPVFLENDIRVKPDLDCHGALGDAGWYCIRSILWSNNYELPKSVVALRGPVLNKAGVILSCWASLHWEDGKVATFYCSFLSHLTMDVTAIGTKGTLQVHDFVVPFQESEASFSVASESGFNEQVTGWVRKPAEHIVSTSLPQEALMVKEFSRLVGAIKAGGSQPEMKWPIISRKTQLVLDAVKLSMKRGFEPVEVVG